MATTRINYIACLTIVAPVAFEIIATLSIPRDMLVGTGMCPFMYGDYLYALQKRGEVTQYSSFET